VTKDEDFAFYEPPEKASVNAFENGDEENAVGPDPANLKFDFDKDASSLWNKQVIEYLISKLETQCQEANLGEVPQAYLEHLVMEKFLRCKTYWNQAKRRVVDNDFETWNVEERMKDTKERHMVAARHRERRVKVSKTRFVMHAKRQPLL
jgi:hypothetical protein